MRTVLTVRSAASTVKIVPFVSTRSRPPGHESAALAANAEPAKRQTDKRLPGDSARRLYLHDGWPLPESSKLKAARRGAPSEGRATISRLGARAYDEEPPGQAKEFSICLLEVYRFFLEGCRRARRIQLLLALPAEVEESKKRRPLAKRRTPEGQSYTLTNASGMVVKLSTLSPRPRPWVPRARRQDGRRGPWLR